MTRAKSVDPGAPPGRRATRSKAFDLVYRIGLLLKAVDGSFEVVAGLVLWFLPHTLARLIEPFAVAEVGHLPVLNLIASWLGKADHELLVGDHTFAVVFLLLHGVVKLALVYCLLRRYHWVYPWALLVLAGFTVYQGVLLVISPTVGMLLLTLLDLAIIMLVWREWRVVRAEDAAVRQSEPAG